MADKEPVSKEPAPLKVDVKIVRDTWEGEDRKVAGTIIQVPIQAALWGIYDGLFAPAGKNPYKADKAE